jgi:4-amino-4-deoxy-L-arabinose transferase-like glycosyltransferase
VPISWGCPTLPGAPLFVLLGRFFIILFGDNGNTAANAVNTMSALASGATILFLFWCVTHFARKMFVGVGEELNKNQLFTVMASGIVGAFAYTFSDSFWFSAGEGEVYALSSFFTALVFWLMLKWEHADEKAGDDPQAKTAKRPLDCFVIFYDGTFHRCSLVELVDYSCYRNDLLLPQI